MIRNRYLLLLDLPVVVVAAFGAFSLRFDWLFLQYRPEFAVFVVLALMLKPATMYAFGMYARYWRYATAADLLAVTLAVSASSVIMAVVVGFGRAFDLLGDFSRPILLIDWLLSLALFGGLRMSVRVVGEAHQKAQRPSSGPLRRVLIAGAGEAGAMVVKELQRNPQLGMMPVGFVDDATVKRGKWISGVQVLGGVGDIGRQVSALRIDEVIIAMPAVGGATLRRVAEICRECGVESRTVPGVFELLDGHVTVSRMRQIEITDLLKRAPVDADVDASAYLADRVVIVTGAGGSIGQELCRQIAKARPRQIVLAGHGENSLFEAHVHLRETFAEVDAKIVVVDVRNAERLATLFRTYQPDVVFHAAAHKHVPLMEADPEEAVTNNVVGTGNVVRAAIAANVTRLVMISTDKAVAPRSIMGVSKRLAEMIVCTAAARHGLPYSVVRFGNVLGSRGSVVPFFQRQIERGGPVTITHPDMKRFFMTIPEAVHLVLQAGGMGRGGEVFVLDMGEPVRIVDLARDMIRLSSRRDEDVQIVFSGLRPGEKLEEALWEEGARVERTLHPHVLRVLEPQVCTSDELADVVDRLAAAAELGDRLAIEHEFARVIHTYVPASVDVQV